MQTIPLREYREQVRLENSKEEDKKEGRFEVARSMLTDGLPYE